MKYRRKQRRLAERESERVDNCSEGISRHHRLIIISSHGLLYHGLPMAEASQLSGDDVTRARHLRCLASAVEVLGGARCKSACLINVEKSCASAKPNRRFHPNAENLERESISRAFMRRGGQQSRFAASLASAPQSRPPYHRVMPSRLRFGDMA